MFPGPLPAYVSGTLPSYPPEICSKHLNRTGGHKLRCAPEVPPQWPPHGPTMQNWRGHSPKPAWLRVTPTMPCRGATPSDWRGQLLPRGHPEAAPTAGTLGRVKTLRLRFPRRFPPIAQADVCTLSTSDPHVRGRIQATSLALFKLSVQCVQHRFRLDVSGTLPAPSLAFLKE